MNCSIGCNCTPSCPMYYIFPIKIDADCFSSCSSKIFQVFPLTNALASLSTEKRRKKQQLKWKKPFQAKAILWWNYVDSFMLKHFSHHIRCKFEIIVSENMNSNFVCALTGCVFNRTWITRRRQRECDVIWQLPLVNVSRFDIHKISFFSRPIEISRSTPLHAIINLTM